MPDRIVAGESIWVSSDNSAQDGADIVLTDYPASGWTLAYEFAASTPVSVSATANGDNYRLEVPGATTLLWASGSISYAAFVTSKSVSGRKFCVESGTISVTPSPVRVSAWAATLTDVDAAIASYATTPHGSVSVDGMAVTFRSFDDLVKLRDYVAYRLQSDSGNRQRRIIRARFT